MSSLNNRLDTTTPMNNTSTTTQTEQTEQKPVTFGNGRYSKVMERLYDECQRVLGLPAKQAEKVARAYGAEFGRFEKENADIAVRLGKLNKNGMLTLTETCKIKNVPMTYAIGIAKLIDLVYESSKCGLDIHETDIVLKPSYIEWLTKE